MAGAILRKRAPTSRFPCAHPWNAGRDALMYAALGPPRPALDAWLKFQTSTIDPWTDPVAIRWLPLIGWNLKDIAHARERAAFQDAWRRIWSSNRRVLASAIPVLDALIASGIRVIVLKGAALAWSVYETPALRPIGDVDILVMPDDVPRARAILHDQGWQPLRPVREQDLMTRHAFDYCKPPFGAIDLHWHLHHECCWDDADADVWKRAKPFPAEPHGLLMLDPADQLLQTCIHGLRWSPVHSAHWVADAVHIVNRSGNALDWNIVVDEARRRRMTLQMREALRLLETRAGVTIPEHIARALDAEPVSWRDRAELHVKVRPVQSAGGMFLLWCGWTRLKNASATQAPGFLRFLGAAVGVDSVPKLVPWMARHATRRVQDAATGRRPTGASLHARSRSSRDFQ